MASYLKLMLESTDTVLAAIRDRRNGKGMKPKRTKRVDTPQERLIKLMNHSEWGPGVRDFIRRTPGLNIYQVLYQVLLKPDLKKWMHTGFFDGESKKNPPSRQEIHDINFRRDRRQTKLYSMIGGPKPRSEGEK